ncbi:efflux pump protein [Plenodomus tracheiphilus IPT5]|uniref:Efflux pump protein n=1 Tax=Plenodomus tracheiphilus IPT5 TaxID=1408161 RepID=A0A6A7ANG9_9PLEO|nr:efflux pump protein [Plenodomus tracheiphilus IPT5]
MNCLCGYGMRNTKIFGSGAIRQDHEWEVLREGERVEKGVSGNGTSESVVDQQYVTGFKLMLLLGSLTLVTFLVLLDMAIIGTAIPRITTDFHSLADVGWYIGAYTLAAQVVYLSLLFIFEIGSLVCGIARSSVTLIVGRAVAGLGASGLINGGLTILMAAVPREKTPMYTGVFLGVSQTGIIGGPLIGGALTEHATWRWCFYINLPIGFIAAGFLMLIRISEVNRKDPFSFALVCKVIPELDLIGFALFVPTALMFLLALQFGSGNTYPWTSSTIIGLFCAAGVMAIIFILWERRVGDRAMIPSSLLRQRVVWTSCFHGASVTCSAMVASNWIPTYFQAVRGEGPTLSGVHVLPSILSQLLFVVVSGVAVSRLGYYYPWALGSGVITAVGNGLVSTFTASTSAAKWAGYQIVLGAGRGMGMQMSLVAMQNAVSTSQVPVSLALLIFFQNLGVSIAIVISNTIFAQTLTSTIRRYAPSVVPQAALDAGSGAAAVRALVPAGQEGQFDGVLRAYSESLRNVFYLLVGIAIVTAIASLGMGRTDVRKQDDADKMVSVAPKV